MWNFIWKTEPANGLWKFFQWQMLCITFVRSFVSFFFVILPSSCVWAIDSALRRRVHDKHSLIIIIIYIIMCTWFFFPFLPLNSSLPFADLVLSLLRLAYVCMHICWLLFFLFLFAMLSYSRKTSEQQSHISVHTGIFKNTLIHEYTKIN